MQEVKLELENEFPFSNLSKENPKLKFYRWCNSRVDYLEVYGEEHDLKEFQPNILKIEETLSTKVIYQSASINRIKIMLSCRCSIENSSIRVAESVNCIWKGPVIYYGGREYLTLIIVEESTVSQVYRKFTTQGTAILKKSVAILPDSLRNTYSIPISNLFLGITEKQGMVFREALEAGYFEIPKQTDIKKLAQRFNISKSTLEEHLNKARSKFFKNMEPYINLFVSNMKQIENETNRN
jgi:predicted DNA binding protein